MGKTYFDKVFFDYRKQRATRSNPVRTVDLDNWLQTNKSTTNHYLCFYVIKANADELIKFGIAGTRGEMTGAWGRLHSYINTYGRKTDLNDCLGVNLMYLAGTKFDLGPNVIGSKYRERKVDLKNSLVFKKELFIKRHFRNVDPNNFGDGVINRKTGRGFERVLPEELDELFRMIDDRSNKAVEEIETPTSSV